MARKKITKYAQITKHLTKYPKACKNAAAVRKVAKKFNCTASYVYKVHDKLFGPKRGVVDKRMKPKVETPVAKTKVVPPRSRQDAEEIFEAAASPTTTRGDILDTAKQYITKDRAEEHGDLDSNFTTIAAYWSTHLNTAVSATDVAVMMNLVKIARIKSNPTNMDNWIDGCGYLACGAELAGGD
tara:strand:- start:126 stop:677 length:552 start_codon:yes stop_codon:yes gene_type:complete